MLLCNVGLRNARAARPLCSAGHRGFAKAGGKVKPHKANKKKKMATNALLRDSSGSNKDDVLDQWALKVMKSTPIKKNEPLSEEELKRHKEIVDRRSNELWKRTRRDDSQVFRRMALRDAALASMPEDLLEEALNADVLPPPMHRHMPFWTPPREI
mmetsp:Transcript_20966/g.37139  ORF Transcript_20966/g.37139 Transcript_20966/m.37139 type:complete len:156 (+) Transcript_20966:72-539(+)|eukprot:CAMPEP_0184543036 /NCGR_PEP_ID=MMETSP0199_2-20130426/2624_1 /TAXON_ID=1112570 /ORGANISM="Thraustochytrium sp., Strain LLF1b" /LENGTH=155 /DNA_ID=CAMNT_0026937005 /DNA_START=68 /DNA_END=535 /DNA_ORIENTATION=-